MCHPLYLGFDSVGNGDAVESLASESRGSAHGKGVTSYLYCPSRQRRHWRCTGLISNHTCAPRSDLPESTRAMVEPNSLGFGATVRPQDRIISAFSAALSPAAEMMAPACPIRRPLGAVSPATKPTTGFDILSLIHAEASASCGCLLYTSPSPRDRS